MLHTMHLAHLGRGIRIYPSITPALGGSRPGAMAILLAVAAATLTALAVAPPAMAGTCYGDDCSGKNPMTYGPTKSRKCAQDGNTVAHLDFDHYDARRGESRHFLLELRWSAACKTNWARISAPGTSTCEQPNSRCPNAMWEWSLRAVQESTGYTRKRVGRNSLYRWTSMIYSPAKCVYAQAIMSDKTPYRTGCV